MEDESYLIHYGKGHLDGGHSGRYEWGSGDDPYQRYSTFLETVHELKRQGVTEANIAKSYNMSTTQLRAQVSIAKDAKRAADAAQAYELYSQGKTASEIGRIMGRNESSIRALLDPAIKKNTDTTKNTADVLKEAVDQKGIIDIGIGSELYVGVSRTKLMTAVEMLKEQGYVTNQVQVDQLGTAGNKKTYVLTLCPPGTTYKDVVSNMDKIQMVTDVHTNDDGMSFQGLKPVQSVDSNRIFVRYGDEGLQKEGVIELRRGIEDISLGDSNYAQVRIAVDGTHYMKGMAMYADDIPEGYDIVFNTKKSADLGKIGVMKELKNNPDNPFGATIKAGGQREYIDPETGEKKISCINIVNEEGDWDEWSRTLSSQMLSKQSPSLAKQQLNLDYNIRKAEYDDIMAVDNPTVKKKLLEDFAESCDSASVHLQAAALPRMASHVLLPITDMDPNEIYAPKYQNGEKVVLIRYPHGGTFEIPELTVNNNQKTARRVLGDNPKDAVGINAKTAEKLSGADFDGDSVMVIPNNDGKITTSVLKDLAGFDTQLAYPGYPGMKAMTKRMKGIEMGQASNLITDMTIKGASSDELVRAVKYSMVVIDAEKHKLNYKQAYDDFQIAALKKRYQNGGGPSTLISRSTSEVNIPERKAGKLVVDPETGKSKRVYIDPETGKKLYEATNRTYNDYKKDPKTGEYILKKENVKAQGKATRMEMTDDAFTLSSGTMMESIYATYANNMKALANQSRKDSLEIQPLKYDSKAAKEYESEVKSLKAKLYIAQKNAPLERQAQLLANAKLQNEKRDNPGMEKDEIKKLKGRLLSACRLKVGAKKETVKFTDKEWEAVQKGAISNSLLTSLLNNADMDVVKKLATPQNKRGLSSSDERLIKQMLKRGYHQNEIAASLGISASTVNKIAEGVS